MKLQGVFMIIPLLAVVASGSTIPSTDGYSVQRLEKRGDSDSDIKGSTAKNSRVKLVEESGAKGGAQSQIPDRYPAITKQLKGLDQWRTKLKAEMRVEADDYKKERLAKTSSSLENPHTPQRIVNIYQNPGERPDLLKEIRRLQSGVNEDKKKELLELPSSSKSGRMVKSTFIKNKRKNTMKSLNYLGRTLSGQRRSTQDKSGSMENSNQEPSEEQNQKASGDASNKELPENQAQTAVQNSVALCLE
ncbi:hypothetical protein BASA62_007820 [Batrachochytrium salamandrivorans]|nr:hypothetical protein BASA62_007820 [Batrachochytrium salamandrivorans]